MAGGIISTQRVAVNTENTHLDNAASALMNGLNYLRCGNKLLDVSLIVDGRTFKAHRAVLAACSDYFCAMFTDAMCEARQSEIKLYGVNARGIDVLIEYAYTGKLDLDRKNIQDVLSASTHVQMRDVIEACSNFLESQIDLENCIAIATLADLYALERLKKKTYRYICSRLDELTQTPQIHTLTVDQLEHILMCNYPVDCTEERILQITIKYCLNAQIHGETARRLFAKIRYNQIPVGSLKALFGEHAEYDSIICQLVNLKEQNTQQQQQQQQELHAEEVTGGDVVGGGGGGCSDGEANDKVELISNNILTNSRGMELALIKIGGFETNGLTNEISCYLPSKGKWEVLTVIPHIEQCNYGTAVMGNDLYIVGGSYDVCLKEYIHPFGFCYCPTKNKWKTIAPIQTDRCRFSLNAIGTNYLYAVGGVGELNDHEHEHGGGGGGVGGGGDHWPNNNVDSTVSNCERYNVSADSWEYLPALVENRSQHAGVTLADKLYISGGIDRHIVLDTLWCFDTTTEQWQKLCSMPTPRADHSLIVIDNQIYACGGWYEDATTEMRVLVQTIDVYDATSNQWHTEAHNPLPKYYTGITAIKRKIYFIGGLLSNATINRATSAVHCYDLDTKQWTFNAESHYPNEVWECTCATFYVPRERDDGKYCWGKF